MRQRNIDFNAQLTEVCAEFIHCRFDNNAAFNTDFGPSDISTLDFFHPSIAGQTKAASATWGATYDFSDNVAPVSTATMTPMSGVVSVSLTATDDVGVAGIEYRINSGGYQRYSGVVTAPTGSLITYRAVDVNGNVEASHSCLLPPGFVPAFDYDCDGWTDPAELYIGTDPLNSGTPGGWPPDPAPEPDGNCAVQIDDVTFAASAFGSTTTPRAEIASPNGKVQIDDVTEFASRFGDTC